MSSEPFSRNTFDPRRHSAVALAVTDRQPNYLGPKGEDVALKHYMVGPNVPPPGLSVRRAITAPVARKMPNGQLDPTPRYLNYKGQWVQEELPSLIAESHAQPLTATSTFTATLPGYAAGRSVRPVTAVHTFNDISPVVAADMVHDADQEHTVVKESTVERPRTAVPMNTRKAIEAAETAKAVTGLLEKVHPVSTVRMSNPDIRRKSIDAFWQRQAGTAFNLGIPDLDRMEELGRNVPPGSANTVLIGSKWRYIQRPVDGDVIYTDYYGRCGDKSNDYYGRAYNINAAQFQKNRMVGDIDYVKVQASMPGIHGLRTRAGVVMDSTIVNGPAEKLQGLSVYKAQTQRGLHRLNEFARLRPHTERENRSAWQTSSLQ